jgi:hypothetical protein
MDHVTPCRTTNRESIIQAHETNAATTIRICADGQIIEDACTKNRVQRLLFDECEMTAESPPEEKLPNEHDTLKYSLLGPSLTKSGQDDVDQQKVSQR